MKFIAAFITCGISVALALPWVAEPRSYPPQWMPTHNQFVENTRANYASIKVIFYGDYFTQGWNDAGKPVYDQYYHPLGTANYGLTHDNTENTLWRIQNGEITNQLNPAVCVLMIGANHVPTGDTAAEIAMGIVYDIHELHKRLPRTNILVLGILPRTNEEETRKAIEVNDIIKGLEDGGIFRFLDMKDHFYRGGNDFVAELYSSSLYGLLSQAGYRKWAEVMNPLFRELLNNTIIN